MTISAKQNYLNALQHKGAEYTPCTLLSTCVIGLPDSLERGPWRTGGYDGFGVRWIVNEMGPMAPIPANNEFILKDITKWKDAIQLPDVENHDWDGIYMPGIANVNREETLVEYCCANGVFERLAALMGFEGALMAMMEEPEACTELFNAVTDYKIEVAKKVSKFSDLFVNFDDVATHRNTFMSQKMFHELIMPQHKRLFDAVKRLGMIPIQHTCGKCEAVIPDFIEAGAAAWTSAQPSNNIAVIIEKYGNQITVIGGYDINGFPGTTRDPEVHRAETRRCLNEYGGFGKGYILTGAYIDGSDAGVDLEIVQVIIDTYYEYMKEKGFNLR